MASLLELERQVHQLQGDVATWRRDAATRPIRHADSTGAIGHTQFAVVREIGAGTEPYIMVQRLRQISSDQRWAFVSATYEQVACFHDLVSAENKPFVCTIPGEYAIDVGFIVVLLVRANLSWVALPWTAPEVVAIEDLPEVPRTDCFPPGTGEGGVPTPLTGENGDDGLTPATFDSLVDVTIAEDVAAGEIPVWDAATEQWINRTLAEAGIAALEHAARHLPGGADALAVLDFFNGTFLESFDALVTSDGATVTMSIEKVGGGDLTENFSSGQTTFDCTPAATIALTAGTDTVPVFNRVYILQSAPGVLVKSTTAWPSDEHNKIAFFSVPSASLVNTGAAGNNFVYANQNWNDNAAETATDQGHMADMAERLRRFPASWFSGCQGVATQDGNDLWVSVSTGVVYQLHPHTFAALDSDTAGAGDPILVVNDPDANYAIINSLNEITKHSDGDLIANNKYVKFVLSGVANKTGEVSLMILNLPSEHYNTVADARNDVEGYANFTIPAAFTLESSTGFLIAAFVCKHTATAMELQETIDLRGQTPTTASGSGTGGGDVSAAAVLTDNAVVRGDGGAKGVQTSTVLIADTGVMSVPGIGDGGYTSYDLCVGNVTTPSYGMIQMGNSAIGRTSYKAGAIDLDGAVLCRNISGPVTSEIEFIWTESTGGTARFALPKSAVGNATYNSRSMLLAGPAPADTDFVKVSYWQGQGIFDNLACDTAGDGADLGVQNDLEVEGDIFVDSIKESTTDAGITAEAVLLKDGLVDGVDVAAHAANGDAHHNESHDADSHPDIDTTTDPPVLNDVMKWNGSDWVPGTAGDTTEFTFSIDSFTDNDSDFTQLIGLAANNWKAIAGITFSATYSNAPGGMTAEVAMSGADTAWAGNLSMTPVTGPEDSTEAVTYPTTQGQSITFTLSQSADASEATLVYTFTNTMRYGTNALTQGNQTEASLEALTEVAGPNEGRTQNIYNIPNAPTDYVTFAYADRLSDVTQVRMTSGLGFVTASFAAAATTLAPDIQVGVANVDNSASFVETFACLTSRITGLADGTNDFQLLQSSTVSNYMFWGELAKASSYTEADVEDNIASEPGQVVSNDMSSREMTVNAAVDEYTYIAYPARLGALTSIMIGGFESIGDFNVDSTTLAITNDAGYQENYRVYVSVNPGFTDPTTMTVTI